MSKLKKSGEGDAENVTAHDDVVAPNVKAPRMHVVPGRMPREIVRSYYDPKQNTVIDVVKVEKVVQNRKGEDVFVTLERKEYCRDEAVQAKYRRDPNAMVEVDNG